MSAAQALETEEISCADARMAVRAALAGTGRTLPEARAKQLGEDALLVVSELVTNALVHAGGVTRLDVRVEGDEFQLRVSDASRNAPVRVRTLKGSPGGYGMVVIQRLCARLDVEIGPEGKTITAALSLR
ncbi:ATP-binding protein [Streptomyces sp. NPDC059639]|uniref:ATP-binding protein n=1 Tax=Streptomyces sp. NPDC059639 TaxID=3346891 RepID=UPI003691A973